jgi:endonuclease/exonuclease/phosphatase family metal-dependent hydrolase
MRKPILIRVAALLAAIAIPAITQAKSVTVMTRNLYLGADLTPAIAASDIPSLAVAASGIWAVVQATNFPDRAKALAREIKKAKPDLIGLQEAALWRTGIPDGPPIFGGTPATTVVYDFLQSLLDDLDAIGAPYDVVIVQAEADLESITASGFDIRLTQRDVILARQKFADKKHVALDNAQSAHFVTNLTLPLAGGLAFVTSTRGWTAVDVTLDKQERKTFRFINTHLEAFHPIVRDVQANELIAVGGPADTGTTVVLAGDLNSDALQAFPDSLAINTLLGAGFTDTWLLRKHKHDDPGLTCCYGEVLLDPDASGFNSRIDHVLTLPETKVSKADVVGTDPDDRSPDDGLWPSDHAGVVTKLEF